MNTSKKWRRMADIYRRFAAEWPDSDFSCEAAVAMFRHESFGEPMPDSERLNGFSLGQKWMCATVAAWKQDIADGLLTVPELLRAGYEEWFLRRMGGLSVKPDGVGQGRGSWVTWETTQPRKWESPTYHGSGFRRQAASSQAILAPTARNAASLSCGSSTTRDQNRLTTSNAPACAASGIACILWARDLQSTPNCASASGAES